MPRYLVERTFPQRLELSCDDESAAICAQIVLNNSEDEVTWIHSYVSSDRQKAFCIYDPPSPEARSGHMTNSPGHSGITY